MILSSFLRTCTAALLFSISSLSAQDCSPDWVPTFVGGSAVSNSVISQAVFDDGTGPALYAGGNFTTAGGQTVNRIARWNGASWATLGTGLSAAPLTMTVFDDGSGAALYVGGLFATAGGQTVNGIARWDGADWSSVGSGVAGGSVFALEVYDDGSGPALYAGGNFTSAGGTPAQRFARWNGQAWNEVGGGVSNSVFALRVFDDGTPVLAVGGAFTEAGSASINGAAKWDGVAWTALGTGVSGGASTPQVRSFAAFDDGNGAALYAGGLFASMGGVSGTSRIARWDGSQWSELDSGITTSGFNQGIYTLAVYDDGSGPGLYAGGDFLAAGGVSTSYVARWDSSGWSALGPGMQILDFSPAVRTLIAYEDGSESGEAVFVGGASVTAPGGGNFLGKWQGCPPSDSIFVDGFEGQEFRTPW